MIKTRKRIRVEWRGESEEWQRKNTTDILRWYQYCKARGLEGEMRDIEACLVRVHSGLVFYSVRSRINPSKLPAGMYQNIANDLTQAGLTALLRTIRLFDPKRGIQFSTYATRAIILDMLRFIKQSCRNSPAMMGDKPWKLVAEKEVVHNWVSCDGIQDLRSILEQANLFLSDKELLVIRHRFGLDGHRRMTLQQLGDELGVTKEAIRQVQVGAIVKLRQAMLGERCLLVAE